jgi:hypothetical protein
VQVAGVCIEYCVMSGSLELLFGDIFQLFKAVRQEHVFLEEIEPYILKREVSALPQHILTAFVDCCARSLKLAALERCTCYLDLNNNNVAELAACLSTNALFSGRTKQRYISIYVHPNPVCSSGFLYVQAYKVGNYAEAFMVVFEMLKSTKTVAPSAPGNRSSGIEGTYPSLDQSHIGYKLLLFCKYVAENKIFPRGDILLSSPSQIGALISGILMRQAGATTADTEFPVLMPLAKIDSSGSVYCSSLLISRLASSKEQVAAVGELYSDLYAFVCTADRLFSRGVHLQKLFFSFALDHLTSIPHQLSPLLLNGVVAHCSAEFTSRKEAEEMMFGLAARQSKYSDTAGTLRDILVRHSFWKALLGMQNRKQFSASKNDFEAALRFYSGMRSNSSSTGSSNSSNIGAISGKQVASEELVFDYISSQFTAYSMDFNVGSNANVEEIIVEGQGRSRTNSTGAIQNPLTDARKVLCRFLVELFNINEQRTTKLACQYLANSVTDIISSTTKNPMVQYAVLKALIHEIKEDPERELSDYLTHNDVLTYIRLLLAFNVDDAYKFLSSTSHYPLDEALALCREKEVLDASAHLLERAGDASGALSLLCTDISKRIQAAKAEIDALLRTDTVGSRRPSTFTSSVSSLGPTSGSSTMSKADISRNTLHQILQADKQSSVRQELAASLPCYAKMLHVTDLAANICSRQPLNRVAFVYLILILATM